MNTAHPSSSSADPSIKWSIYAGLYMFVCGTVAAFLLSDMLTLLADVIGLSTDYWMIILASPALAIGSVVWWIAVERRDSYTYLLGGAFGLVTALLTGFLWTVQFIIFWGFEMAAIPIITVLILFVLGFTATAGVITSIPLMYARRRLNGKLPNGKEYTI